MALEDTGGRQTFYGQLPAKNKFGGKIASAGAIKEIRLDIVFDDLPGADDGNVMVIAVPAGAKIVASDMKITEAWIGGTDLIVGMEDIGGGGGDPNGLHTVEITAVLLLDAIFVGNGALIGALADAGGDDQVIVASTNGAYTAGAATLIVQYLPYGADAA